MDEINEHDLVPGCECSDCLRHELKLLREKYAQCHSELLEIHGIACAGWANVLQHPITSEDTLTVRDVKIMAMELMKYRTTSETPNVK